MDWNAVGALAELLGAIGVIASLVYLAIQIRQNTSTVVANTFQSVQDSSVLRMMALAENDELAERFVAGLVDPDALDGAKRFQFDIWMRANFKGYENYFYQHKMGLLDAQSWSAAREAIRVSLSPPGVPKWWTMNRRLFRSDFGELVDEVLAEFDGPAGE